MHKEEVVEEALEAVWAAYGVLFELVSDMPCCIEDLLDKDEQKIIKDADKKYSLAQQYIEDAEAVP